MRYFKILFEVIQLLVASILCRLYKNPNDIWLINEKPDEARDNGYAFYQYLRKNFPDIKVYYVISKESTDIYKFNNETNIVFYKSFLHFILYIKSKVLISSQTLPYPSSRKLCEALMYLNLNKPKRIWLQHGVTKDKLPYENMAREIFKYDLITCVSLKEANFIMKEYGYNEDQVKALGFARYDNLPIGNNNTFDILIMPTFRKGYEIKNFSLPTDSETKHFEESVFFKTYVDLLNSEELDEYLEKSGKKAIFYLHYAFQPYAKSFSKRLMSSNVIIAERTEYDVQKLLINCELLITDYSSVFFDFSYMKKPEIFFHFDEKEYRSNHYREGYFDYKTDGFGPVVNSKEELLTEIKEFIDNPSLLMEFNKRANNFFKYTDNNNCQRILKEIWRINETN